MATVSAHRYRAGAVAWLLTLQFFVAEAFAAARFDGYARADDLISVLGGGDSPAQVLMNASFVVQGLLIAAGVLLLRPALAGAGGRTAPVLLGAAALGVVLVGLFPLDGIGELHGAGAGLYLVGGGTGLIALAYGVRRRSELLGTTLALLGLLVTSMTVFSTAGITGFLGEGGTERAAAYPIPVGLALAGVALVRLTRGRPEGVPGRREQRAQEREERSQRARARNAALEAAASRAEAPAPPAVEDDFDPDDPWAQSRRPG
jgi:hypothetical membrane protein